MYFLQFILKNTLSFVLSLGAARSHSSYCATRRITVETCFKTLMRINLMFMIYFHKLTTPARILQNAEEDWYARKMLKNVQSTIVLQLERVNTSTILKSFPVSTTGIHLTPLLQDISLTKNSIQSPNNVTLIHRTSDRAKTKCVWYVIGL